MSDRPLANLTGTALTSLARELEERIRRTDADLGQLAMREDPRPGHYESILRLGGARKAYGDLLSFTRALLKEEQHA